MKGITNVCVMRFYTAYQNPGVALHSTRHGLDRTSFVVLSGEEVTWVGSWLVGAAERVRGPEGRTPPKEDEDTKIHATHFGFLMVISFFRSEEIERNYNFGEKMIDSRLVTSADYFEIKWFHDCCYWSYANKLSKQPLFLLRLLSHLKYLRNWFEWLLMCL